MRRFFFFDITSSDIRWKIQWQSLIKCIIHRMIEGFWVWICWGLSRSSTSLYLLFKFWQFYGFSELLRWGCPWIGFWVLRCLIHWEGVSSFPVLFLESWNLSRLIFFNLEIELSLCLFRCVLILIWSSIFMILINFLILIFLTVFVWWITLKRLYCYLCWIGMSSGWHWQRHLILRVKNILTLSSIRIFNFLM